MYRRSNFRKGSRVNGDHSHHIKKKSDKASSILQHKCSHRKGQKTKHSDPKLHNSDHSHHHESQMHLRKYSCKHESGFYTKDYSYHEHSLYNKMYNCTRENFCRKNYADKKS